MRKALTLIELVFTIVIISLVFSVIPKVVLSLNKSDKFSIRQDALLNGVSMLNFISKLPWDENNTNSADILHVTSGNFNCDSNTTLRVGGFVGARSCEENLNASILGTEGASEYTLYNDFDDFLNENNITASHYRLETKVQYTADNFNYTGDKLNIDLNQSTTSLNSTNLKRVDLKVFYVGKRGDEKEITRFNYTSSNIGQILLNKRAW